MNSHTGDNNGWYKIIINDDTNILPDCHVLSYSNFEDCVTGLYTLISGVCKRMHNDHNLINKIIPKCKICVSPNNFVVSEFGVKYVKDDGLYLFNNLNNIRLASIFPMAVIFDNCISSNNLFRNTQCLVSNDTKIIKTNDTKIVKPNDSLTNKPSNTRFMTEPTISGVGSNSGNTRFVTEPTIDPKPITANDSKIITTADSEIISSIKLNTGVNNDDSHRKHSKFIQNEEIYKEKQKKLLEEKPKKIHDRKNKSRGEKNNSSVPTRDKNFDEIFELSKEIERDKRVEQFRRNEKFKMFESDKGSYIKIKKDIDSGLIKASEVHPFFALKYQIFKLLESRKVINFSKNDNIVDEYKLFRELYEECDEDNQKNNKKCDPVKKVYIPHNYQYMTDTDKELYANKYNLTKTQFEEKYINTMFDDGLDDFLDENPNMSNNITISTKESVVNNTDKSIVNNTKESVTNNTNELVMSDTNESNVDKNSMSVDSDDSNSDSDSDDSDSDNGDSEINATITDQKFLDLIKEFK